MISFGKLVTVLIHLDFMITDGALETESAHAILARQVGPLRQDIFELVADYSRKFAQRSMLHLVNF
jgi:hypothetical protein